MTPSGPDRSLFALALTKPGVALALRLRAAFPGSCVFAPARFAAGLPGVEGFDEPLGSLLERLWPRARGFFLVMAAGIAVRTIAPLLSDKRIDPAVVVLDPEGRFAVPLLSGHLGGANDLAREVGARLGSVPVITTATDVAGTPAVEVWARDRGLRPEGPRGVIRVNAAWASGEPVSAYLDPDLEAPSLLEALRPHLAGVTQDQASLSSFSGVRLAVTHRLLPELGADLFLRPPCLHLGVGSRRGADPTQVEEGVRKALSAAGLSPLSAASLSSVDEKASEPALLALGRSLGVPLRTFPARELSKVPVPTPSPRVARAVGTPSVSEAASLLASSGGRLILPKVTGKTWTLAASLKLAKPEE